MGRVEGRIKIESYFQRGEKRRERKIDVDVEARRVYIRYTYKWVGWIKASVVTFHVSRYIFFPLSPPPLSRLELRFSDFSRRYFSRGKYLRVLFFTRFACLYRFEILCLRCPFFLSFFFLLLTWISFEFPSIRVCLFSFAPWNILLWISFQLFKPRYRCRSISFSLCDQPSLRSWHALSINPATRCF